MWNDCLMVRSSLVPSSNSAERVSTVAVGGLPWHRRPVHGACRPTELFHSGVTRSAWSCRDAGPRLGRTVPSTSRRRAAGGSTTSHSCSSQWCLDRVTVRSDTWRRSSTWQQRRTTHQRRLRQQVNDDDQNNKLCLSLFQSTWWNRNK